MTQIPHPCHVDTGVRGKLDKTQYYNPTNLDKIYSRKQKKKKKIYSDYQLIGRKIKILMIEKSSTHKAVSSNVPHIVICDGHCPYPRGLCQQLICPTYKLLPLGTFFPSMMTTSTRKNSLIILFHDKLARHCTNLNSSNTLIY